MISAFLNAAYSNLVPRASFHLPICLLARRWQYTKKKKRSPGDEIAAYITYASAKVAISKPTDCRVLEFMFFNFKKYMVKDSVEKSFL